MWLLSPLEGVNTSKGKAKDKTFHGVDTYDKCVSLSFNLMRQNFYPGVVLVAATEHVVGRKGMKF